MERGSPGRRLNDAQRKFQPVTCPKTPKIRAFLGFFAFRSLFLAGNQPFDAVLARVIELSSRAIQQPDFPEFIGNFDA